MKQKLNFLGKGLLLLCLLTLSQVLLAQRVVSGKVTDGESNEPLIGASVMAEGTNVGTVTDYDGNYKLTVPAGVNRLKVSYTGYSDALLDIIGNTMNVTLSTAAVLDEIVVVGYGTVRKSDATGAVSAIEEKSFNKGIVTSPEQLMQGRVAGVQITQNSGQPGGGINVRIRGTTSVRAGNNPLFVVDGVPLSGDDISAGGNDAGFGSSSPKNPLNFLNPNDIEKIDILKDASATAIYGARGANGVVLITTKSGRGKGALDYTYSLGISNITKKYDLLSASEYIAATGPSNNLGAQTDWQDVMFRTALSHDHTVAYGASSEKGNYRLSVGYLNQDGIIQNSGMKRYSARFNATQRFMNDRLTMGVQSTIANIRDQNVPVTDNAGFAGDFIGALLKSNPTMPLYKDATIKEFDPNACDTCVYQLSSQAEPNPAALLNYSRDRTNTLRALANLNAEFKIMDGFTFRSVVGVDRSLSQRRAAFSRNLNAEGIADRGRAYLNNVDINNSLWENYFNYTKRFGDVSFTGLLGYSYQQFNISGDGFELANFRTADPDLMINNLASVNAADGKIVPTNSYNTKDELQSYFGRVNFGYKDKYLLTASLRRDGSTRFGGSNKYGNFPSLAFKWRVLEEGFLPKNIFSDLGVRIGWGLTGNQELPHNLYTQRQRYGNWDVENNGNVGGGGLGDVTFTNPDLKWESTSQTNFGIDFGFLDNRVSGSLDFYDKHTRDLLIRVTSAQPAPTPFVWRNLDADIQNRGVELGLNVVAIDGKDFDWDVNLAVGYNQNIVKNFGGIINTGAINGQGLTGAFAQRIAEGQPLFAFFLRDWVGFDDQGNNIYGATGDKQVFLDGKSPLPKVTGGLTNTFRYKGFDLSIFLNGVFGNYIYSNTANAFFTKGALNGGRNVTKDVVGSSEGKFNSPDVSTRFLEKGDFIRLQNLSLGYNVPIKSQYVSGLRLFVIGQNLALLYNKYSGQDPEVNTNKALNDVPSFGIDYTAYPRARTITLGGSVTF